MARIPERIILEGPHNFLEWEAALHLHLEGHGLLHFIEDWGAVRKYADLNAGKVFQAQAYDSIWGSLDGPIEKQLEVSGWKYQYSENPGTLFWYIKKEVAGLDEMPSEFDPRRQRLRNLANSHHTGITTFTGPEDFENWKRDVHIMFLGYLEPGSTIHAMDFSPENAKLVLHYLIESLWPVKELLAEAGFDFHNVGETPPLQKISQLYTAIVTNDEMNPDTSKSRALELLHNFCVVQAKRSDRDYLLAFLAKTKRDGAYLVEQKLLNHDTAMNILLIRIARVLGRDSRYNLSTLIHEGILPWDKTLAWMMANVEEGRNIVAGLLEFLRSLAPEKKAELPKEQSS